MAAQVQNLFLRDLGQGDGMLRDWNRLTPREQQVLDLIGKGKTTKEIATILKLSTGTVGNHRKSICRKWDVHSTAELVYRAGLGKK
ncbi:MAG TPA: LuxR C-terminal-related transcriptional regulator [Bryobacteraceae bacterium]|nr:LuxR C-terminal-related transcriptional regulator [Bryobacteraceae bacterium]